MALYIEKPRRDTRTNRPQDPDLPEILYEDEHILVCDKPCGTAVQSRRLTDPDLVSILKNHIHRSSPKGGEPYLAVIHRLDQPVRGILVFAKTPAAAKELNRQLTCHEFGKYYRALVAGRPPKEADTLEDYLVKDPRTNLSRVCGPDTRDARLARLHYQTVSDGLHFPKVPGTTELDIRLDTGRHHQIRVQVAHTWQEICLCACRLDFYHPKTHKPLQFRL